MQNWFGDANSKSLVKLMSQYKVETIIELGSWMGGSTAVMARLLPEGGKLYAVDIFEIADGDKTVENTAGCSASEDQRQHHWDQFRSNMIH